MRSREDKIEAAKSPTASPMGSPETSLVLARKIVNRLFVNGQGQNAKRLVLELADNSNGGGWCVGAAVEAVRQVLGKHIQ